MNENPYIRWARNFDDLMLEIALTLYKAEQREYAHHPERFKPEERIATHHRIQALEIVREERHPNG